MLIIAIELLLVRPKNKAISSGNKKIMDDILQKRSEINSLRRDIDGIITN